jgi:dienelactone hydrolase
VGRKKTLLEGETEKGRSAFVELQLAGKDRDWRVFVPRKVVAHRDRPPILLLHEMPALSPGVLELALRLSDRYSVYVPLLFGREYDDNNSKFLGLRRALGMAFFRPAWNALGNGERKITQEMSGLCSSLLERHPKNARLAVIGMCISGNLPLQLAGEKNPLPQLKGLVLSQPSLPLLTCTFQQRQSLGISPAELSRAKSHVTAADLQILGFRFQLDPISPPERFERLNYEFGSHFIDRTVLARDYVFRDEMPSAAHAVLTDGFCPSKKGRDHPSAGKCAYCQLRGYLQETLKGQG